MDASRQLMLNEEQLEDMRQELVRQYQEHQQATELLRQAHMRQMERQREDQEQLQEEIKRLNKQLAQVWDLESLFSPIKIAVFFIQPFLKSQNYCQGLNKYEYLTSGTDSTSMTAYILLGTPNSTLECIITLECILFICLCWR